jgi:hypothetical protein
MSSLMLLLGMASALAARLELIVDSKELVEGQTVAAQLHVIDGVAQGVPQLSVGQGLSARFQGQSQSTTILNFQTTRVLRYTYALTAVQPGLWKVGPVSVDVGGQRLNAGPVEVQVRERSAEEKSSSGVTTALSDPAPYEGEVVVYTLRHRTRERIYEPSWSLPSVVGFEQERSAENVRKEYVLNEDGVEVQVSEVMIPLRAAAAGEHSLAPATLTAQVPVERKSPRRRTGDPFFDSPFGMAELRPESWSSRPLPATVRPLPAEGRPASFSGLVGDFQIKVSPESAAVKVGDSITLEISLSGTGSLSGFRLPALPEGLGLRAYDDEPVIRARMEDGRYSAVAMYKRALVPEKEGTIEVPGLQIPIFDPERGYRLIEGPPLSLDISPGEQVGAVASFGGVTSGQGPGVDSIAEDVLPPPADPSIGDHTLGAALPLALGLGGLPALAVAGLALRDRARSRTPDPRQQLLERLRRLPSDPAERLAELEQIFREEAGLRLSLPAPGLDRAAVAPLGEAASELYQALEAARYGGGQLGDVENRVRAFVEGR